MQRRAREFNARSAGSSETSGSRLAEPRNADQSWNISATVTRARPAALGLIPTTARQWIRQVLNQIRRVTHRGRRCDRGARRRSADDPGPKLFKTVRGVNAFTNQRPQACDRRVGDQHRLRDLAVRFVGPIRRRTARRSATRRRGRTGPESTRPARRSTTRRSLVPNSPVEGVRILAKLHEQGGGRAVRPWAWPTLDGKRYRWTTLYDVHEKGPWQSTGSSMPLVTVSELLRLALPPGDREWWLARLGLGNR